MIGRHLWDYIFIRTCILFLHLVVPLSVIYSLVGPLVRLPFRLPRVLQLWLALEAAFYLAVYLPRKAYLQKAARHPLPPCREERKELFERCHSNIPDPVQYLRKWFRGAPVADIKRENVKDFFRWAFFNTGEREPAYDEELEEYVGEMEKLLGRKLEPGRGNAKCLRLTLDKVEMLHRSLAWYLCVFVVDTAASMHLWRQSFKFYRPSFLQCLAVFPLRPLTLFSSHSSSGQCLTYWHRPHTSKTRLPILFIHGIGIGLYPYINFLADLNADDDEDAPDGEVGIIAIEIMSISSRITTEAMTKEAMSKEIQHVLEGHGWQRVVLVSHSYGSVVATHLLRSPQIAQKIGPVLFVDPVSFLLHLPDVAYNFICRKPSQANEYLLSYFGSKDMGVSHTLFRRFFWADNILWKEDIRGRRVTVALAGRDIVVDTSVIRAYLTGSGVAEGCALQTGDGGNAEMIGDTPGVLWFPDLDHGQVLYGKKTRRVLTRAVRTLCKELPE
ncbi:hypothetical protein JDV02_003146 [Purpureocillium takamizusanense]|uniref:AB hydrolase-1 domain-containing protein n=1 Tax=Purpureocillium takamizusanense TaxID=2060973 RepID=A0A9Q8QCM1_9HYPO|nr:uncharacterized protein JDV02_003146 [Purpureocillium takamizusanense]UNI16736.1 hypothetical protein JDV02_003146 [Purpureocillium takamizusanense]